MECLFTDHYLAVATQDTAFATLLFSVWRWPPLPVQNNRAMTTSSLGCVANIDCLAVKACAKNLSVYRKKAALYCGLIQGLFLNSSDVSANCWKWGSWQVMCLHRDLAGPRVAAPSWDQCRLHLSVKSSKLTAWLVAASLSKSSCYHGTGCMGSGRDYI